MLVPDALVERLSRQDTICWCAIALQGVSDRIKSSFLLPAAGMEPKLLGSIGKHSTDCSTVTPTVVYVNEIKNLRVNQIK